MDMLMQDLRFALRQLRKHPGFTTIVVLMLGLGIGANSALFGIVNAALLRPLPYPNSGRIASISLANKYGDMMVLDQPTIQLLLKQSSRSFDALAAYTTDAAIVTGGATPERVGGGSITPAFFRVMAVQPAIGRGFTEDDARRGHAPVVILGHDLWVRDFNSDPRIIGQTVKLDDRAHTVVGVMPDGFHFPGTAEFWRPLTFPVASSGSVFYESMLGRLRDGVSVAAARGELATVRHVREAELPPEERGGEMRVMTLHERLYGDLRPALLILLGTVACVLLIACANVANLLLARATSRRKELALRAALGASRARLVRQLLVESLVLALLGGVCGLLIPAYGLGLFTVVGPQTLTRVPGIVVDNHVLVFTLVVSLVTGLLFGLAPAVTAARASVHDALKDGASHLTGIGTTARPRRLLVTVELAVTVVLLIGAGLLVKSFVRFQSIDPGFDETGVLTARITLPELRYPNAATQEAFFQKVLGRARALPGVQSASLSDVIPLRGPRMTEEITMPNADGTPGETRRLASAVVGPEYFRTFRIPLRAGREFTDADETGAPKVTVISEGMARLYFPGKPAVGEQLALAGKALVIGIVSDVRQSAGDVNPLPTFYLPFRQSESSAYRAIALRVRPGVDPMNLAPLLQQAVRDVDPEQPITGVQTMEQVLSESMAPRRFNTLLLGAFAALALLLSTFGLYGLLAYLVAQRTHEIGVRMALGAERHDVLGLVLRQGMVLTAAGIILGLVAAFWLTRLLASQLFHVQTTDPFIFAVVPVVLIVVSVIATLLPARRATQVDPAMALRAE
ncbi:MAG TPA: ABC transporter permease [Gemmatimonadaceae bacterium]|nr:ABC transporter permease [Gemmatimonadaceae bacterium]